MPNSIDRSLRIYLLCANASPKSIRANPFIFWQQLTYIYSFEEVFIVITQAIHLLHSNLCTYIFIWHIEIVKQSTQHLRIMHASHREFISLYTLYIINRFKYIHSACSQYWTMTWKNTFKNLYWWRKLSFWHFEGDVRRRRRCLRASHTFEHNDSSERCCRINKLYRPYTYILYQKTAIHIWH